MKERPILFKGPMVRAILEGRKTQTRRVVKPQPTEDSPHHEVAVYDPLRVSRSTGEQYPGPRTFGVYGDGWDIKCRFGQPGDRLWVRETFQEFFDDEIPAGRTRAVRGHMGIPGQPNRISYVAFRADGEIPASAEHGKALWRPSIFMRPWASRITLEVTAIRVERLRDISEADAMAEGSGGERYIGQGFDHCAHREAYRTLWESINGPGSWAANPWVWVVEFKRVTP